MNAKEAAEDRPAVPPAGTPREVFGAFLKLGLTSFGGPIAHLGYFRDELVARRKWIDEKGYAYCAFHGVERRSVCRCRKLRPWELRRLLNGDALNKY